MYTHIIRHFSYGTELFEFRGGGGYDGDVCIEPVGERVSTFSPLDYIYDHGQKTFNIVSRRSEVLKASKHVIAIYADHQHDGIPRFLTKNGFKKIARIRSAGTGSWLSVFLKTKKQSSRKKPKQFSTRYAFASCCGAMITSRPNTISKEVSTNNYSIIVYIGKKIKLLTTHKFVRVAKNIWIKSNSSDYEKSHTDWILEHQSNKKIKIKYTRRKSSW